MSDESLKKQVTEGFAKLGMDISFDADEELNAFKRGRPLLVKELQALPEGAIVWIQIRKFSDEDGLRGDSAFRVSPTDHGWMFDDGSSMGCDWSPIEEGADVEAPCVAEHDGWGWTKLFVAEKLDLLDR